MVYSPHPPYEILQNRLIDFSDMQRMRRFARFWDLSATAGILSTTRRCSGRGASPFPDFLQFRDWLAAHLGRRHSIALNTLAESLFIYLTTVCALEAVSVDAVLSRDWRRTGRKDPPHFLAKEAAASPPQPPAEARSAPKRQARHLAPLA